MIVASGTSNRQTKALAASVRDAVREAGFPKPRVEGEENGEWIIVDCGAAVAHIMQPAIRQYYHLEEIWGEKPVRVRFGAPSRTALAPGGGAAAAKAAPAKTGVLKRAAKKTAAAPAKKASASGKGASAKPAGKPTRKAPAKKAPTKKATTKKTRAPTRRG